MKKLNRISLHNLSLAELAKREEALLRGGDGTIDGETLLCVCVVGCSCLYEGEQEGPDDPYYGGASKKDSGASNGPTYQVSGNM